VSEYQYYEFVAMDRPLNDGELTELRSLSTRAQITPTSLVNEYHWSNFRGDPAKLMEHCFDAHFYFANWGSRRLMLRLPHNLLDLGTAEQYAFTDLARVWSTDEHVILDFRADSESEDFYDDTLDWRLASVIGVRNELAAGDLRVLYLGWLLAVQAGLLDDDELEPPVPPGMGSLSASLHGFADFFRIEEDMLAVAAAASADPKADNEDMAALARWIEMLPDEDKNAMLMRVVRGDSVHLRTELLREFHGTEVSTPGTRTVGEIIDAADALRLQRIRTEREQQAEAERLRAEQAAAKRRTRLEWLARNEESSWQKVESLIDTKKPAEYETAVDLLLDLRAVSEQQDKPAEFGRRVAEIRDRHQRKVSLLGRFTAAGLN
jgi:hypothetical protein